MKNTSAVDVSIQAVSPALTCMPNLRRGRVTPLSRLAGDQVSPMKVAGARGELPLSF
jgi:hypothetical protein